MSILQMEKEVDLMMSGVDFEAGTGQFVIDAYVRKASKYLIARLASQNRVRFTCVHSNTLDPI